MFDNYLGAFGLSVMLQIWCDHDTTHQKLYRDRPKASMCIFVVWLFCPCPTVVVEIEEGATHPAIQGILKKML